MIYVATTQLYNYSRKVAISNKQTNGHGSVPLGILKFELYIIFMCHEISFFWLFQLFESAKSILRSSVHSVQFSRLVMSNSPRPHELQHARSPCPSPSPGVHSDSRPLSPWCHPAISSSVVPFSCPSQHQSLFQWINSSHEVAKVLDLQF